MPSRIPAIDGLRGVLALLVVIDHFATELGDTRLGFPADVSVAVFFLLSGLVLTRAWDGHYPQFLARRFIRLWPVFAICLVAGGLLARHRPPLLEFFWLPIPVYDANILCPPMWSLFIEAWTAPAMPMLVWSARGGIWRTLGCMAACLTVAAAWHPAHLGLRALSSYSVFFVAGAGLHRRILRSAFLESALPQWLGRVSYSLYLSHWLVLRAMTRAFGPAGTWLAVPVVFGVAWSLSQLVERPSIRLSRQVSSPSCK